MSLLGVNDNVKTILVSRSSVKPDFFYIYTKFQHIFGKLSEHTHTHTHTEAQTQTGRQTDRLSLSLSVTTQVNAPGQAPQSVCSVSGTSRCVWRGCSSLHKEGCGYDSAGPITRRSGASLVGQDTAAHDSSTDQAG